MRMDVVRALLFLLTGCVCVAQAPIRVDVNLINVGFSVRDTRNTLVTNLTADDFEVFEDGAPQKISFFAHSADVPLTLGLIVDFSGSQEHFVKQHHHDVQTFLKEVLGPRDRVFLLGFGNRLRLVSDFSPSGADLMSGLKEFEHDSRDFPELGPQEIRRAGTAFYDAIYYAVNEKLASAEGSRRALVVFSDGEDNSSAHHMMDAIEASQSANVLFFGLRYTELLKGRLTGRNKYGIRVMDRIASETGGVPFDAQQGELNTHFRQIAEELRSSYALAYHSTNPARDATFRKIVIRPKQAGLIVRTKTGYYAR